MYRIGKTFQFEASHQLRGLPEGHQCGRLHGHSYEIELTFVGAELAPEGWLFDFGDLKTFKAYVDEYLDHRHLNDILAQPTSEALASFLFDVVDGLMEEDAFGQGTYLEKVRVSETEKTFAEYFGT